MEKYIKLYNDLYSLGADYANVSKKNQAKIDSPAEELMPQTLEPISEAPPPVLCGSALAAKFGYQVLSRATWGATYSSFLYILLLEVMTWIPAQDTNPNNMIQWIEL